MYYKLFDYFGYVGVIEADVANGTTLTQDEAAKNIYNTYLASDSESEVYLSDELTNEVHILQITT